MGSVCVKYKNYSISFSAPTSYIQENFEKIKECLEQFYFNLCYDELLMEVNDND